MSTTAVWQLGQISMQLNLLVNAVLYTTLDGHQANTLRGWPWTLNSMAIVEVNLH